MSVNEKIDVSPDDSNIVYSFCDSSGCSIQEISIATGNSKKITPSDRINYICPRYSPDGRKILFLTYITDKGNSNRISIYNKKTSNIAHISTGLQYVTEASFSKDGIGIYFIALTFPKLTLLKSEPTFSYDIYFIDTLGKNLRRVTEFGARSISGVAFMNSGSAILTNVETFDKKYKFYQVPIAIGEQPIPFDAYFMDGTKVGYNFTFSPSISPDEKELVVASARILTRIDMQSRQAMTLYSSGETFVYSPRFFNASSKIAFTRDSLQAVPGQHPIAVARKIFIMDIPTRSIVECPLPKH
ncbi:MAG: PD40 domain-containing protein [Chitinispirillaceae bacterium]|nr:PD40 domain-containing protein [Chitinispirillaceae bacterium]